MLYFRKKIIYIVIVFLVGIQSFGQTGYLSIPDTDRWLITIDDTLQFPMNKTIVSLPTGEHTLTIQSINNKNWLATKQSIEIFIQEADTFTITPVIPKFNRDHLVKDEAEKKYIDIGFSYQNKKYSRKKYIKPAILATAVVSNWASFYIKRKADDYYDIYLETSDLNKIDKYYNRAANYDIYANILLGISATALTVYFYYLMTD